LQVRDLNVLDSTVISGKTIVAIDGFFIVGVFHIYRIAGKFCKCFIIPFFKWYVFCEQGN
jgi:hypothetical protein